VSTKIKLQAGAEAVDLGLIGFTPRVLPYVQQQQAWMFS
jgi:hypothetical protein